MASNAPAKPAKAVGPTPKIHSACDECRARKLRCSSTLPKCARCQRENLVCVYSPMKTMGRPRKKRKAEGEGEGEEEELEAAGAAGVPSTGEQATAETGSTAIPAVVGTGGAVASERVGNSSAARDLGLHGMWNMGTDTGAGTEEALEGFFGQDEAMLGFTFPTELWEDTQAMMATDAAELPREGAPISQSDRSGSLESDASLSLLHGRGHVGHGTPTLLHSEPSSRTSVSPQAQPIDPSLSSLAPAPPCTCLSTSYLTLNSLQTLPTYSFPFILSPLRQAIAAAYSILTCPLCPQTTSTAMVNVQLLNALLQSILERILRTLKAIDDEAEHLEETGATKAFRIGDSSLENAHLHTGNWDCGAAFDVDLKGPEWRRLARKAIRTEVKGLTPAIERSRQASGQLGYLHAQHEAANPNCANPVGGGGGGHHAPHVNLQGRPIKVPLIDVIQGMIKRQDEWHNDPVMDKAREAMWGNPHAGQARRHGEDHDCVKPLRHLVDVVDRLKLDDD